MPSRGSTGPCPPASGCWRTSAWMRRAAPGCADPASRDSISRLLPISILPPAWESKFVFHGNIAMETDIRVEIAEGFPPVLDELADRLQCGRSFLRAAWY